MATHKLGTLTRLACRFPKPVFPVQNQISFRCFASSAPKRSTTLSLAVKGIIGGALVGGAWSTYSYQQEQSRKGSILNEKQELFFIDKLPDVKITRKILNSKDDSGLDIVLFQFQTCPFCCKVRAFLDFFGFSYSVVEVDAVLRQSIKWSPYQKVPILLVKCKDGRYVQLSESSMIVSTLASFLDDKKQDVASLAEFYPTMKFYDDKGQSKTDVMNKYFVMYQDNKPQATKEYLEEERKWRKWADTHLVHLISPNVYRTKDEALETFEWFSEIGEWNENFPRWERNLMVYVGAIAMWAISKRLKKRHNLTDDVRVDMYNACDRWTKELKKHNKEFSGGKTPNLADLAVFGILSSMEGCQAFQDCLENTNIGNWFYAVKAHVMKNRGQVL